MNSSRAKRVVIIVSAAGLVALAVALSVSFVNGIPKPHLSREQAEAYAHYQLQIYCSENNLDIRLFGLSRAVRGTLAHAELRQDGSVYDRYVPTWDYHYTYKGTPLVTVVVSYDSKTGVAEVADVVGD